MTIRKIASPEEIREHVQKLVDAIPENVRSGLTVHVPLPQQQPPDEDGCNWNMASFSGVRDYDYSVRTLLEQVRQTFNLPQQ
jgi:hypothetical protein